MTYKVVIELISCFLANVDAMLLVPNVSIPLHLYFGIDAFQTCLHISCLVKRPFLATIRDGILLLFEVKLLPCVFFLFLSVSLAELGIHRLQDSLLFLCSLHIE
jgi:hypothetical protein